MKQSIIIITVIISMLMVGCKKQDDAVAPGSIHGIVSDASSGELIQNASVKLQPKGLQTVTGSDGRYHFAEIDPGQYNLFIEKVGYQSLSHNITVNSGESANGDVQIEKLPASLQIMDNDGQPVTELNFGGDPGIVSKTFKIYNKGTEPFSFEINKYVDWIESITPHNSTVVPVNGNCPVVVKIDRSKLADGQNTTSIIITSPTVGGVELIVKARSGSSGDVFELPAAQLMVQLEDLGCVNWSSAKTLCESSTVAGHNDWRLPTKEELMTLYNNREEIGGFTTECYWSSSEHGSPSYPYYVNFSNGDLRWEPSYNSAVYYVRAVRTYIPENDVFELTSANLMVQTQDLGNVGWNSAKLLCENSTVGDYNDWRLPTKEELMVLYNNRDIIGGFTTEGYWSSSESSSTHYYVNFGTGSYYSASYNSDYHNVRAVRTLNGTPTTTPTIETLPATNITTNSATCGGNVTEDGGADVTERGVCWSLSSNPTINNNVIKSGSGTGSFTCNMTDLNKNTDYYVKAYAKNSQGIAYGDEITFKTEVFPTFQYGGEIYQVAPDPGNTMVWCDANSYCNNLTLFGLSGWRLPTRNELVQMYSERESIGDFLETYSGVYWSSTSSGQGTYLPMYYTVCFYNGEVTSCEDDYCDYYVRPIRPVNGNSTTVPSVTTSSVTNISTNSATCGGNVTTNGGAAVTARGVCWSTSQDPTISGNHTTDGTGTGTFTSNITGLAENTTYYVRAYATNSVGTSYGSQKSFTTTGGGGGQTYSYSFENGMENWTSLDADGDGYGWVLGSQSGGIYLESGGSLSGSGHNSSIDLVCSGSYSNVVGVLTPNNYLVSPQKYAISSGAKISFYVCAQDSDYPAEHYGVAISTASNPSANSFTTIWEETLSAKTGKNEKTRGNRVQGSWYLKTIDLSNYTGQTLWIAIRHFNCTDQFILDIDDITIVSGN